MKKQVVQVKCDYAWDMALSALEFLRQNATLQHDKEFKSLFDKMNDVVYDRLNGGIDGEIVGMYMINEVVPNAPVAKPVAEAVAKTPDLSSKTMGKAVKRQ